MEKSINIKAEEFKQNLFAIINNSNLPVSMIYYMLKWVLLDVENTYYGTLNEESIEKSEIDTDLPETIKPLEKSIEEDN